MTYDRPDPVVVDRIKRAFPLMRCASAPAQRISSSESGNSTSSRCYTHSCLASRLVQTVLSRRFSNVPSSWLLATNSNIRRSMSGSHRRSLNSSVRFSMTPSRISILAEMTSEGVSNHRLSLKLRDRRCLSEAGMKR